MVVWLKPCESRSLPGALSPKTLDRKIGGFSLFRVPPLLGSAAPDPATPALALAHSSARPGLAGPARRTRDGSEPHRHCQGPQKKSHPHAWLFAFRVLGMIFPGKATLRE